MVCRNNGLYADAVSRAYYAVMHGAKAALESRQVSVTNHRGVRSRFALHFVRPGLVEREWSSYIVNSFKARVAADYDATAVFDDADARIACDTAAAFLDRIRELLAPGIGGEDFPIEP